MENNQYNRFYSKKPVSELIGQLREHKITGHTLDKKWYEALITHFSERQLSDEERELVEHILGNDSESLSKDEKVQIRINETQLSNKPSSITTDKYPALRVISGLLTGFAVLIGITTLIIIFTVGFNNENSLLVIITTLVMGGILILGVLATSESIKVIIDIEYNTRQKIGIK